MPAANTTTCKARKRKQIRCTEITEYLRLVETGKVRSCERQKKLCAYVRRVFATEELVIDTARLEKYKGFIRFFPFDRLFPWETFLLALFLCVYRKDGEPRWDELICIVGRGAGKNGLISFFSWCLTTAANGIERYNVNIVANSEEQAMTSFNDVRDILDGDPLHWEPKWRWNKKEIVNRSTGSKIKYLTSGANSKDGGRPGMVVFDEVHEYVRWKLVEVMTTGLGKVDHGRAAYITSMGDIRDGVLDSLLSDCDDILDGDEPDNGRLPFVCTLDSRDEVHDEKNWEKANPSLRYLPPRFVAKLRKEYQKWRKNPAGGNASFMTRRMGIPQGDIEHQVTSWENLKRASRPVPDLTGWPCVLGLDFAKKDDFVSAVLLFKDGERFYAIHHSWFCLQSRDRARIKPPLDDWAGMGILTLVDDVEVHTSLIRQWVSDMQDVYDIEMVAIDDYRYDTLHEALRDVGYDAADGTVFRVRPSNHMRVQPIINSAFLTGGIAWGDDPAMRWFTNNTKVVPFANGNYKYEKISPRDRKTDGFMALVAAFCIQDKIPERYEPVFMEPLIF